MRDFYPDDVRLQNWLFDTWRAVSRSFGFEEYEGPIFEFLDLYRLKSGDEIVNELFNFTDRGAREFAIRPEMTPSLARMVAARANALPRPIKWFSIPRMCRAEKPQRGRLREFFQWNLDVLGVEDPLADAEVISAAVAFFRACGLTSQDVMMRISHRGVASAALAKHGIPRELIPQAFAVIDKFDRLTPEAFTPMCAERLGADVSAEALRELVTTATMDDCLELATQDGPAGIVDATALRQLWGHLESMGVADVCTFDLRIVRGLAYYTGSVFEAHARQGGLRALCGGGRYDDLTGLLDGPRVPGVGFGMGDVPMIECLKQLGKLPDPGDSIDVFVIDTDASLLPQMLEIVADLRSAGLRADFSYKRTGVGKQFKQAGGRGARYALIVGDELAERGEVTIKDLRTGQQQTVAAAELRQRPVEWLGGV
jgi:histidyl-tRNA synthetase